MVPSQLEFHSLHHNFGSEAGGLRVEQHPRLLADMNGDDMADVVGFGHSGLYVSLSTGTSFTAPQLWVDNFGYEAENWRVDTHPRLLADVTGDGKVDVIGFADDCVWAAV